MTLVMITGKARNQHELASITKPISVKKNIIYKGKIAHNETKQGIFKCHQQMFTIPRPDASLRYH